jgi:hypothetical protein
MGLHSLPAKAMEPTAPATEGVFPLHACSRRARRRAWPAAPQRRRARVAVEKVTSRVVLFLTHPSGPRAHTVVTPRTVLGVEALDRPAVVATPVRRGGRRLMRVFRTDRQVCVPAQRLHD